MPQFSLEDMASHRQVAAATRRSSTASDGLTLVEMLVSMIILSIVLAATAASLITFTQTARANERQVQATGLLNRANEEFQAAPWDALGTLPSHLALSPVVTAPPRLNDDAHLGSALSLTDLDEWVKIEDEGDAPSVLAVPMEFAGPDGVARELALTADSANAILAYDPDPETDDGRDYELYQLVTWVDKDGDGTAVVKRLTAIVRWEILGRPYEETFVAERAASVQEAGEFGLPRLLQFDIFPLSQELELSDIMQDSVIFEDEPTNSTAINVAARFTSGVENVRLEFYTVDVASTAESTPETPELELQQFFLGAPLVSDLTGGLYFVNSIPRNSYVFPQGSRTFRLVADLPVAGGAFSPASRILNFTFDGEPNYGPIADPDGAPGSGNGTPETPPGDPVEIATVTPSRTAVRLFQGNIQCDIDIGIMVTSGLEPDDAVDLTWTVGTGATGTQTFTPSDEGTFNEAEGSATFVHTLTTGEGTWSNNDSTGFTAKVRRGVSSVVVGQEISESQVVFRNGSGC